MRYRLIRGFLLFGLGLLLGVIITGSTWPTTPKSRPLPKTFDIRVSISDGYLTRRIQRQVQYSSFVSIRGVQVTSSAPLLVVDARAAIGPLSVPVSLELEPIASGANVRVRVVAGHVANIPVPGLLTGLLADDINDSLKRTVGQDATITGVIVTRRGLDITANYP